MKKLIIRFWIEVQLSHSGLVGDVLKRMTLVFPDQIAARRSHSLRGAVGRPLPFAHVQPILFEDYKIVPFHCSF
jgi:hypothetical protein